MRLILALAILLLGLPITAPDIERSSRFGDAWHLAQGLTSVSLVASAAAKADREMITALPGATSLGLLPIQEADIAADLDDDGVDQPRGLSMPDLCNALLTSAQDNDLPVAFFANLIWQESRLRDDVVSPKGALGIAQFMPKVAMETGLENPLDPMQALPASARLLHDLRMQFGNLGLAAAAYNAGPRRVSQWLARHRSLPRETRGYVVHITGRSIEQWKKTPIGGAALHFTRQLPCRELPAFAELEDAKQGGLPETLAGDDQAAQAAAADEPHKARGRPHGTRRFAQHLRGHRRHHGFRIAARNSHHGAHHTHRTAHAAHTKHRSA